SGTPPPTKTSVLKRPWGVIMVLATIVLALLGGTLAGWYTRPPARSVAAVPAPDLSDPISFQKHREQWLLTPVKECTNRNNPRQPGLRHIVELAQLYFNQGRLDDADRFFTALIEMQKNKGYTLLGQLGHAMVLAFRDQTQESTDIFLELFKDMDQLGRMP